MGIIVIFITMGYNISLMERIFVGQGSEHMVFRSQVNPEYVLKIPYGLNSRSLHLYGDPVKLIQQEIEEARSLTEGTKIVIPHTEVFPVESIYFIAQKYIEEDGSLDISSELDLTNIDRFIHRHNTRNFRSNQGILYWLDPTKGPAHRIITRTLLQESRYSHLRAQLREFRIKTKLW